MHIDKKTMKQLAFIYDRTREHHDDINEARSTYDHLEDLLERIDYHGLDTDELDEIGDVMGSLYYGQERAYKLAVELRDVNENITGDLAYLDDLLEDVMHSAR